ncbi:MAG: NAD(P)-dependent oxidoreductase [Thermoleophilaceae bacterium]
MVDVAGKRVALVGGAGFIGHQLAIALKEQGAEPHVIDGLAVNNLLHYTALPPGTPNRELYIKIIEQRFAKLHAAGVPIHVQDARDYHALSHILDEISPQTIVHLAAIAHAGKSNKDPMSTFGHSLRTLENALDFARADGVEHFVFFSSSMVYGNFQTPEVSEDHPLDPIGIYGALKLSGEKIVTAYKQVFDLDYTIIRPSALYGPGCVSRRVSQIFIESALVGDKLRVDGDGDERLDFSYIGDVVDGVLRAVGHPAARNECFNITAGNARQLRELIELVREHFPEVEVEYVERDALRPYRGTLSIEKARRLIGYDPQTTLEDGLDRYVAWYRDLVSDGALAAPPA